MNFVNLVFKYSRLLELFSIKIWFFDEILFLVIGSYHVYLVVNVFLGKAGYTFEDFPQFEDWSKHLSFCNKNVQIIW